jgi:probable HAF family extracellular repeat protein
MTFKFRGCHSQEVQTEVTVMNSISAGFLTLALVSGTTPLLAQTYNITDLGAVSGQTVSVAYGLGDLGQASGVSENPSGAIATLFSDGKAINLGTLEPMDVSVATSVNGSSEVVGFEYFSSDPNNTPHAWLYSKGSLMDIHSPFLFPAGTKAQGINDSGVVVGQGLLTSSSFHAFLYSNGAMVDLGPPGAYQAMAVAINDSGEVVGNYFTAPGNSGPFLYSNGKFTNLGAPPGTSTSAFGLNSLGQVAGAIYFNSGTPPPHAAVYSKGVWTDLGGVTGVATHATGINTADEVIATAYFPVQSYHPFRPGKHVGYIVRNGALVDLNTLIAANSGFTITDAVSINDSGEILCDAKNLGGHERAVILTPR